MDVRISPGTGAEGHRLPIASLCGRRRTRPGRCTDSGMPRSRDSGDGRRALQPRRRHHYVQDSLITMRRRMIATERPRTVVVVSGTGGIFEEAGEFDAYWRQSGRGRDVRRWTDGRSGGVAGRSGSIVRCSGYLKITGPNRRHRRSNVSPSPTSRAAARSFPTLRWSLCSDRTGWCGLSERRNAM
jgi:hypothetical protein